MSTTPAVASEAPGVLGQIESRSIDWVPPKERHGTVREQFMLWFLGNFQPFSIATGFLGVQLGLSLGWAILAGALGILTGTLFMAFHASQGPVFGLPQMIQSRAQFGYRGVVVALFASFFTFMAFNVVDQIILSHGFNGAFGWNTEIVAVAVTVIAAVIAIFGHDSVHKVFRILLYISFPLIVVISLGIIFGKAGGTTPAAPGGFNFAVFMTQLSLAAAYNITYAPYVSDYSRYLPKSTTPKPLISAVFFGASGSAIWLIALGAWMASRLPMPVADSLVGLQLSGNSVINHLGGLTTFVASLSLIATMGMNAYGAMLTVITAIDSVRAIKPTRKLRIVTVIALAAIWYLAAKAMENQLGALFSALTVMLFLLVPWTAINLVDYFFVRRGHYAITHLFRADGVYGAWSRSGLIAFAAGLLAQIPFLILPFPIGNFTYAGWAARHWTSLVDYSWLIGLVVAGGVYFILSRGMNTAVEQSAIAESDQELERLAAGWS